MTNPIDDYSFGKVDSVDSSFELSDFSDFSLSLEDKAFIWNNANAFIASDPESNLDFTADFPTKLSELESLDDTSLLEFITSDQSNISIVGEEAEVGKINDALGEIISTESGRQLLLDSLTDSDDAINKKRISVTVGGDNIPSYGEAVGAPKFHPRGQPLPDATDAEIVLDPRLFDRENRYSVDVISGGVAPENLVFDLVQELFHADNLTDNEFSVHITTSEEFDSDLYPDLEEYRAQQMENKVRDELGVVNGENYGREDSYNGLRLVYPNETTNKLLTPEDADKKLSEAIDDQSPLSVAISIFGVDLKANVTDMESLFVFKYQVSLEQGAKSSDEQIKSTAKALEGLKELVEDYSGERDSIEPKDAEKLLLLYQRAYSDIGNLGGEGKFR